VCHCPYCVLSFIKKLSFTDIEGYAYFDLLSKKFGVDLVDYPELKKLYDEVESQPNIKNWIETRPKTEM